MSVPEFMHTFHSQREANLDSYMSDLHSGFLGYQEALQAGFINGMEERIPLPRILHNKQY